MATPEIGSVSPELQAVADKHYGWKGTTPIQSENMATGHDYSFFNKRANRQEIGQTQAGHLEPDTNWKEINPVPMAAIHPDPWS